MTVSVGRAIALAFEHTFSGEGNLLEQAVSILNDALVIGENNSQPSFWWLTRLLRLMLSDHGAACLWRVIPPFFGPDGASKVAGYVRLLAFSVSPVTELWQSQKVSLQVALNEHNRGGVINLENQRGKNSCCRACNVADDIG